MRHPFDFTALRERLAQRGLHPARHPGEFQHAAEVVGLTPGALGHDRCAALLHRLRREAEATTGGAFALVATYDPQTRERQGYTVYTDNQQIADEIAAAIQRLIP